jgi:hypothetical protein
LGIFRLFRWDELEIAMDMGLLYEKWKRGIIAVIKRGLMA